ncbi:HEAT repeat domain-containing protein [Allokutzneria oryzae]|uniref:HEAT repeat domain-containing protein n=1 Tax=Allokutzneria oryzae TaxID=1378989 RepID=A0ABV5ZSL8_9PSEU
MSGDDIRDLAVHRTAQNDAFGLVRAKASDDPDPRARKAAIAALVADWPGEPDTFSFLHERVVVDSAPMVRTRILRTVAKMWPKDKAAMALLRRSVQTDAEHRVRLCAAVELMRLEPDESLSWLHECVSSEEARTRRAAIVALCTEWPDAPETLAALHVAATDQNDVVRAQAVMELGGSCSTDQQTLRLLHERLADSEPEVRVAAIGALRGREDAGTVECLYRCVTADDDTTVRTRALQVLSDGDLWPCHPEAITWLVERTARGPHDDIRRLATLLLAQRWAADRGIRATLRKLTGSGLIRPQWSEAR